MSAPTPPPPNTIEGASRSTSDSEAPSDSPAPAGTWPPVTRAPFAMGSSDSDASSPPSSMRSATPRASLDNDSDKDRRGQYETLSVGDSDTPARPLPRAGFLTGSLGGSLKSSVGGSLRGEYSFPPTSLPTYPPASGPSMSSATGAATESAVSITMPVLGDASQQVRWDLPTGRRQRESEEDADAGNVFAFQRPTTAVTETAASTTLVGASDRGQNFAEPPINGFTGGGKYDISHPAPFAGSHNINNSIFASGLRHRAKPAGEDPEGAVAELAFMNAADRTTRTHPLRPPPAARPETANTDWTEGSAYRPNMYTPSTIAGDATLADGKTTWGDGLGGQTKDDPDDPELFIEEDSPYAEVRAAVSNLDDRNMPALTLRAWVIGVVSTMLIAAANVFLMQRSPAPTIPVTALLVLVYPIGRFAAWLMPIRTYKLPKWLGGRPFSFNPCPFNVKEHTIIVMMANVAITPAYGLNSIIISEIFYKQVFPIAFAFLYILVSQVLGMTMAGVTRRFLVDPPSMLWPGVLVTTTTLNTLHAEADHTHGMTRLRFFLIVVAASFFYYFIPGYLFQALSYFSFICWIKPRNNLINTLFGVGTGMGLSMLTFDWSQISWVGSPLTNPWFAQTSAFFGFILFYWIINPILHFSNVWSTGYLPIMSLSASDRFGKSYNVTRVVTSDFTLNKTAYAEYSPVYLPSSFTITYMLAFALTTMVLVHTALFHGSRIWKIVRGFEAEPNDIHNKLMLYYRTVPSWWYVVPTLVLLGLGIVAVEVFDTGLPWWGFIITFALTAIYLIPIITVFAVSNLQPPVNLIAQLIPGYIWQGLPFAGMNFKAFAVEPMQMATYFSRDMKLGHYMKIPPRDMFVAQMTAAVMSVFVQVGVKHWIFSTVDDICTVHNKSNLSCPQAWTGYSASIIWGLVGPARLFSKGGIYNAQLWMLLIGAVLPFPIWFYLRKHPHSILRNVHFVVLFSVCAFSPPATGVNIISFSLVGFFFQFYIRRRHFTWWSKYNYVLSAALDVGTLMSAILIFVAFRLSKTSLNWWGNSVFVNTLDMNGGGRLYPVPEGGFGPDTWKV